VIFEIPLPTFRVLDLFRIEDWAVIGVARYPKSLGAIYDPGPGV